jgi:hypothetical protein
MPATLLDARLLSGDRHQRGDDRGHSHGALLIGAKEERGGGDHPGAPPPGRLSDDDLAAVAHPTRPAAAVVLAVAVPAALRLP